MQLMFETFETPCMYLSNQARLALFESGRVEGVVLDCGFGVTQVVPISQGSTVVEGVMRSDIAGSDLSSYLTQLLTERGYSFTTSAEQDDVDDIKHKLCYAALDFNREQQQATASSSLEKSFDLPTGQTIKLTSERSKCPECLFQPSLLGADGIGVHEQLYYSILKCPPEIHTTLYENIVLGGGSTLFPGFADRLKKEIRGLAPPGTSVKILAPPERKYSVWIGGSILASLTQFQSMWVKKSEYDETGPTLVHSKCD